MCGVWATVLLGTNRAFCRLVMFLPRKRLISCGCVLPLDIHAMVLVRSKPIGKASAASLATLHISWGRITCSTYPNDAFLSCTYLWNVSTVNL